MLDWLFDPFFKVQTCVGVEDVICHNEPGMSPIVLVIIGAFIGLLGIATLINNRKDKKLEKDNGLL